MEVPPHETQNFTHRAGDSSGLPAGVPAGGQRERLLYPHRIPAARAQRQRDGGRLSRPIYRTDRPHARHAAGLHLLPDHGRRRAPHDAAGVPGDPDRDFAARAAVQPRLYSWRFAEPGRGQRHLSAEKHAGLFCGLRGKLLPEHLRAIRTATRRAPCTPTRATKATLT